MTDGKRASRIEKYGAPSKLSPKKAPKIGTRGGPSKGGKSSGSGSPKK